MKQTSFHFLKDFKKDFGGSLLTGKRKTARPLSTKHPLHLVLKSTGSSVFNTGHRGLEGILRTQAKKYHIKIYGLTLNWSHIHLTILIPSRKAYLAFIRTTTALIVSYLSKIKGKSLAGLFDLRPFTKIITWGKQFRLMKSYHELNELEAWGLVKRKTSVNARKRAALNIAGTAKG